MAFFDFFLVFYSKKGVAFISSKSESIISRLILIKCKQKKLAFFDQKDGLIPLKKNVIFLL